MSWKWLTGIGAALGVVSVATVARAVARSNRRRLSVWWDVYGPPTVLHLTKHIANLKALGVTGVTIMLNEPDGRSNFTDSELATFTSALRRNNIEYGFDVWSYPTPEFVASLPELIRRAVRFGAQYIEFDTEGNWTDRYLRGYGSLEEAGRQVAQALARSPVPWGITTNTGRLTRAALTLGKRGSFVVPQAYSVVDNDEPQGTPPGAYQARIYDMTRRAYSGMKVVMGLAAWDQEFPGIDPSEAIVKAATASYALGVREVRFWSWKYIGGNDGTPRLRYAYNAMNAVSTLTRMG